MSAIPKGAATANCKRCQNTPVPSHFGSLRKCAFDENGIFTSDNWNCVTAGELRYWEPENEDEAMRVRRDDQSYAAIWIPPNPADIPDGEQCGPFRAGGFIAMYWYKERGCTESMIRVDPRDGGLYKDAGLPLTASEAEAALVNLEAARAARDSR